MLPIIITLINFSLKTILRKKILLEEKKLLSQQNDLGSLNNFKLAAIYNFKHY